MKIAFDQPKVRKDISNKDSYSHIFEGVNLSSNLIKLTGTKKGCSCTSIDAPSEIPPKSKFSVTLTVDKTGQTGYYSTYAVLAFDNNQELTISLSGKLIDETQVSSAV